MNIIDTFGALIFVGVAITIYLVNKFGDFNKKLVKLEKLIKK